jgi:Secretion system C-terminal sorting domain
MKKIAFSLVSSLLSLMLMAQSPNPNCSNLRVSNIHMDNDTAKLMKVTLSNTCLNCASGINGCTYMQLEVIKTVSPFDTIASSKCWCMWTPNNNSQRIYSIVSTLATLPALNTIRVSLEAWTCGCDTIPFALTTDINSQEVMNTIQIYPNPAHDFIEIKGIGKTEGFLTLSDVSGRILIRKKLEQNHTKINLTHLAKGFYNIEILDENNKALKKSKIIKD